MGKGQDDFGGWGSSTQITRIRGPKHRPQKTIVLVMGTPKKSAPIFGWGFPLLSQGLQPHPLEFKVWAGRFDAWDIFSGMVLFLMDCNPHIFPIKR